tara:strand:+ start:243 stop:455 length:213 start_codon:yes stop_codon:yes gene_type:complete
MSAEKIITNDENPSNLKSPDTINVKHSGRVDINHLLDRVRKEKQKENKINIIFFVLFAALIIIVGILLSF